MTRDAAPPWRTIKIRTPAAALIAEIQELVRAHGIAHLDPAAEEVLRGGSTAGDVVGAALALLRNHVNVTPRRPKKG